MKRVLAILALVALVVAVPQPAFATPYRSLTSAANPDWMSRVPDGARLSALSIPGTHQSMSIHGGSLTQTQENLGDSGATLTAQLQAGIRAFDIRVRVNAGNTLTVHHGATYQNANLDDVLTRLGGFLAAHPRETVLMRLKQECNGQLGSCSDASGQRPFADIVDAYVARRPGLFWAPSVSRAAGAPIPSLGEVRGRVVLAVLHGPGGNPISRYGLTQLSAWRDGSSTYVQDQYNVPNLGAIATKRDQVRRFLDATSAGDPAALYVNFASGSSLFAHPSAVAGGAAGVQGVNPFLLTYLNEGPDIHPPVRRTGVMMLDFPGGTLIDEILSRN